MPALPLTLALSAGALLVHERRARRNAERLAAALLETLLNAIDATDAQTGAHVRRVARYALILAEAADLDRHAQTSVERVALFHDIGKISEALFDIIHDDRSLSPEEQRAIATHPARGARVLAPLKAFYPDLADGVLAHHECWDGSGYPRRLEGEAIPYAARIVSIADTFDAVTASRRYRNGKGALAGAETISRGRGTQFDPVLADLFLCPPVFDCVLRAQQELTVEQPRRTERRAGRVDQAPDVKFRWRSATPVRLPQDPEIQTLP